MLLISMTEFVLNKYPYELPVFKKFLDDSSDERSIYHFVQKLEHEDLPKFLPDVPRMLYYDGDNDPSITNYFVKQFVIDTIEEPKKSGSNKLEKLFPISNWVLDFRPYIAIKKFYTGFGKEIKFTAYHFSDFIAGINDLYGEDIEDQVST